MYNTLLKKIHKSKQYISNHIKLLCTIWILVTNGDYPPLRTQPNEILKMLEILAYCKSTIISDFILRFTRDELATNLCGQNPYCYFNYTTSNCSQREIFATMILFENFAKFSRTRTYLVYNNCMNFVLYYTSVFKNLPFSIT